MNQSRQFRNRAVLPGLALVALASAGAASASPLPKDPCALLKPAEIQAALAPKTTIGPGVPATDMQQLPDASGPRSGRIVQPLRRIYAPL